MAGLTDFAANRAPSFQRHRHLKWKRLDPLEAGLMVLCGGCIGGFTLCGFLDVVARPIGHPRLWLQQATTAFFAWGGFLGIPPPTRRHGPIYLAESTKPRTGTKRCA